MDALKELIFCGFCFLVVLILLDIILIFNDIHHIKKDKRKKQQSN